MNSSNDHKRLPALLQPGSPAPMLLGLGVVAVGFALIAIGWARVAGVTNVALQLPYLASASITGLAVTMAGLLLVNLTAKRNAAIEQQRQLDELTDLMREIATNLGDK